MGTEQLVPTLKTAKGSYVIEERPTSFVFTRLEAGRREDPLTFEIAVPNLPGSWLPGTGPVAVIDVRGEGRRGGQIVMQWSREMSSFQMTFVTQDYDFVSVRLLDVNASRTTALLDTPSESGVVVIDNSRVAAGEAPSGDVVAATDSESLARPAQKVLSQFDELDDLLTALVNSDPSVIAQQKDSAEDKKKKCESDRKVGWLVAVGTAVLGGIGLMALPLSALAVGIGAAITGAIGGAQAAKTENDAKECKENAEKPQ